MNLILQRTEDITHDIIKQIKDHVPREGLKEDLLNNFTQDSRVQFANNQTSAILLDKNILQSFCTIWQDNLFNKSISESLWLSQEETITLIYLFTPEGLQGNGNARHLIENLADKIKKQLPHIRQIIRTTSSDKNKDIYLSYNAKLISPKENQDLKKLWIEKDYFFTYSI